MTFRCWRRRRWSYEHGSLHGGHRSGHHELGRLRGRGQALYTVIGYGLPGVLGGLGGGLLSSTLGLSSVFWLSGALAAVATLCAWRLRRIEHAI